jgi:hypothetical protein
LIVLDEMGHNRTIKQIPHGLLIRPIFPLPLKQNTRKGCEIYVVHINESLDNMVDHLLTNDPLGKKFPYDYLLEGM